MPAGELSARLPERELSEWMVYAQLEPFGEERADLRMGILASTIANVNRGKSTRPFKPDDFMPRFNQPDPIDENNQVDDIAQQVRDVMERFL